jgi:hypothetical protein
VKIAVPFWGRGVLSELGLQRSDLSGVQVLCNLSVGGCNPTVVRELLTRGANVRALSTLHAKVYLGKTAAVLGSANASADGLGLHGRATSWNEACVLLDSAAELEQLNAWFDEHWRDAADMSNPHIARILLEIAERSPAEQAVDPSSLLEALRSDLVSFKDKPVFVSLDWEPYSSKVDDQVGKLREHLGDSIDAWENWKEMPPAAEVLSFYFDSAANKISFEGIYKTPRNPKQSMDPSTKAIFVREARRVLEAYDLGDRKAWISAVRRWQKELFLDGRKPKDRELCLPLSKFASAYLRLSARGN